MMLTRAVPRGLRQSCGDDEWDGFVDESPQGTIFCRSWWLDVVCPDGYDLLAVRKAGRIIAGMPLPFSRARAGRVVRMPPLTQTLGALVAPPRSDKYESNLSDEMDALRALVQELPDLREFATHCNHRLTNWLPFFWAGYSQTTRYTYRLGDLSDLDAVYRGMSESTRRKIRKAEKAGIAVEETDDLEAFLPLMAMTFTSQGLGLPYSYDLVRRIDRACVGRGARRMFAARDRTGATHAILYNIYDNKSMYYLMMGSDPALRGSGAAFLAHWHAIRFAAGVTSAYDFEGTMLENVEPVFRSFGAAQTPYFRIFKPAPDASLRGALRAARGFVRRAIARVAPRGQGGEAHA